MELSSFSKHLTLVQRFQLLLCDCLSPLCHLYSYQWLKHLEWIGPNELAAEIVVWCGSLETHAGQVPEKKYMNAKNILDMFYMPELSVVGSL